MSAQRSRPPKQEEEEEDYEEEVDEEEEEEQQPKKKVKTKSAAGAAAAGSDDTGPLDLAKDEVLSFELSSKRKTYGKVKTFKGVAYVDFREYYEKDDKLLPGKKGLFLTKAEWENIKRNMGKIDAAFAKLD
jgi:hypothetical protein